MANTCTTEYVFEGGGAQIRALHSKLEEIVSAEGHDDNRYWSTQSNWLGNIAEKALGIDSKEIYCRGEFSMFDVNNCPYDDDKLTLELTAFSAWSPCDELFRKLAEKYDCSLYWIAEELGCELFQTNDTEGKYFHDTIIVDIEDEGIEYFETEKEAIAYIADKTGNPDITAEELEDMDGVYITKVEYV